MSTNLKVVLTFLITSGSTVFVAHRLDEAQPKPRLSRSVIHALFDGAEDKTIRTLHRTHFKNTFIERFALAREIQKIEEVLIEHGLIELVPQPDEGCKDCGKEDPTVTPKPRREVHGTGPGQHTHD